MFGIVVVWKYPSSLKSISLKVRRFHIYITLFIGIVLAFAGLNFGGTLTAFAACTNPTPMPAGYASPCPVFSVSPASVSQSGSLTLTASPQPGTDYIYTTVYIAKGTTWNPYTLQGNNAAPSYSSSQASLTLSSDRISLLSLGTNYVVLWDWLWDATAGCYKGPGLNQCNTGVWRVQTFTLTSNTYAYSHAAYTTGCASGCNNYYVSTTGSDANDGLAATVGGGHGPWATINHADAALTLGANGTIVNVAAGTYTADVLTNSSGSSAGRRIQWLSTTLFGAHIIGNGSRGGLNIWENHGNWVTIQGFDITATPTGNQDTYGIHNYANHVQMVSNRVHDTPSLCQGGGGAGLSSGGGSADVFDVQYIGNVLHHITTNPTGVGNHCHGIYSIAGQQVIENNLIYDNTQGWGIDLAQGLITGGSSVVSNNTFFGNGGAGAIAFAGCMVLADSPLTGKKLGNTSVNNNICYANPGTNNTIDDVASGGSNTFRNNLILGNGNNNPTIHSGDTIAGTVAANPLFVNFQANGSGDYHLQGSSPAVNAGSTVCASGGVSPCTPSTDFSGKARPNPPSIGAYEF